MAGAEGPLDVGREGGGVAGARTGEIRTLKSVLDLDVSV